MTAAVSGTSVEITADNANTAISLNATATHADAAAQKLQFNGDKVVILNERPAGYYGANATGSLTVVKLPTQADDTIDLSSTNGDLTIVSELDLGNTGTGAATLAAANGGITLGSLLTADQATLTSEKALSLRTDVNTLTATVSGSGQAFELQQTTATNLTINTLTINGGDINIRVRGDVVVNAINGEVGRINIVSTHGSVTIKDMAATTGVDMNIEAAGTVDLGTPRGTNTINANDLTITAGGNVTITEADSLNLQSLTFTSTGSIDIETGGDLTINGRLITDAGYDITLNSGEDLVLNQRVINETGDITITATDTMTLAENGDITSISGALSLTTTNSTLTMADGARVNAGSGSLNISGGGALTLGSLRSTGTVLNLTSGAVIDGGDSDLDIDARLADLVIVAEGGIGSGNALEIRVRSIDVTNNTGGSIELIESDDLVIKRIQQNANAKVDVLTVNGDISVTERGVQGQANVSLYAGNGAMTLDAAADDPSVRTINGDITLTAETGDLLINTGIQITTRVTSA